MTGIALVFLGLAVVITAITAWDASYSGDLAGFAAAGCALFIAAFFFFIYPLL
jgi:succinate dehydrogenase hydrophobic anchor subunit